MFFTIRRSDLQGGGMLFKVLDDGFVFVLSVQNTALVLQRNQTVSVLTTAELPWALDRLIVTIMWTIDELYLRCGSADSFREARVPTTPVAAPQALVKWARQQSLLPTIEYRSEEDFRQRVYTSLASVQQKISEVGAHNPFWDLQYDGSTIVSRRPKKETDIHPTIHCLLSDQMLMASIEVVPEFQTGIGNLDFMFLGTVAGKGIARLCAEFKPAHSKDVFHGLEVQLPAYMQNSGVRFGAYCVLGFKGEWFDEPRSTTLNELYHQLQLAKLRQKTPVMEGIRIFMYKLSKPIRASKL
jgi:hypothetical protein